MKFTYKFFIIFLLLAIIMTLFSLPTFAITESEVQQQVDSAGRESVTGNVFIWFLCAIGFLKISQKIDSFMSSLGINVGNTGGSMLAEALIATRGVAAIKSMGNGHMGGSKGASSNTTQNSFMQGGLAGVVGRSFHNSAIKNATGSGGGGLGGKVFASSMSKGGGFANRVIGSVATGNASSTGTITGEKASSALSSYMGYAGNENEDVPTYSNVEIGGGQITATEFSSEYPDGISIGMYHADKYQEPNGDYTTVTSADGVKWYKQYATDVVESKPYKTPDGSIAYNESIVKKLPDPPKRKDKT